MGEKDTTPRSLKEVSSIKANFLEMFCVMNVGLVWLWAGTAYQGYGPLSLPPTVLASQHKDKDIGDNFEVLSYFVLF